MYEIDFLPVGEASRDGDAITVRFTYGNEYVVGVIDAGFAANGDAVVEHIKRWYDTDVVDFVISTHPDDDHISGLPTVLEQMQVTNLLVHQPANHGYVNDPTVEKLIGLAQQQGTKIIEPFTGVGGFDGAVLVAGPTEERYLQALEEQVVVIKEAQRQATFAQRFVEAAAKAVRKTLSSFPTELFFDDEGGDASPRNHGSVIVSLRLDGRHILLPSDTGVPGINAALDYLDAQERTENFPKLVTLPHHGSATTWTAILPSGCSAPTTRASTGRRLRASQSCHHAPGHGSRTQLGVAGTRCWKPAASRFATTAETLPYVQDGAGHSAAAA